jgi:hypothetical protein
MGNFKGSGDGYKNPITEGTAGDRAKPAPKGGGKKRDYDNAPNAEGSDNQIHGTKESRLGGGGTKSGYDGAFLQKDLGVSGHKKGGRRY